MPTPYRRNARTPAGRISATPSTANWGGGLQGLLSQYPGAAGAYSLRKIGSGPVVQLRRASNSDELDFTAAELVGSVEGAELITNGDFATDSDWTKSTGWSITGGQAVCDGSGSSGSSYLKQDGILDPPLSNGDYYIIEIDIDSCSNFLRCGIAPNSNYPSFSSCGINTTGVHSVLCKYDSGKSDRFWIRCNDGESLVINSISAKPYTPTAAELWASEDLVAVGQSPRDSAYVQTWYDQSGSGNHAEQSTANSQPKLITAGVTETENGKPAIVFDGGDDNLSVGSTALSTAIHDMFMVNASSDNSFIVTSQSTGGVGYGWTGVDGSGSPSTKNNYGTPSLYKNGSIALSSTRDEIHSVFGSGVQALTSTIGANTTTWSDFLLFGYADGTFNFVTNAQEVIIYPSDQSTNRVGIETNINDHYGIY